MHPEGALQVTYNFLSMVCLLWYIPNSDKLERIPNMCMLSNGIMAKQVIHLRCPFSKCHQREQNYAQTEPHIPSKEQISGHTQSQVTMWSQKIFD